MSKLDDYGKVVERENFFEMIGYITWHLKNTYGVTLDGETIEQVIEIYKAYNEYGKRMNGFKGASYHSVTAIDDWSKPIDRIEKM